MSHPSTGYFYFRYTYQCPYTDDKGERKIDNTYHSAVYTSHRADHAAQTKWFKEEAVPAAQADIQKNFYGDANRNKKGYKFEPFDQRYVHQEDFTFTTSPDKHTDGPLKGEIFGKKI